MLADFKTFTAKLGRKFVVRSALKIPPYLSVCYHCMKYLKPFLSNCGLYTDYLFVSIRYLKKNWVLQQWASLDDVVCLRSKVSDAPSVF